MKTVRYFMMAFALVLTTLSFTSCNKSDCADGVMNGNETGIDCGGECAACATCTDGIMNGDETGVDCGGSCSACAAGLQEKEYQSSGTNVAPLLTALFGTDSIYADFNLDNTYLVEQFDTNNVKIEFTGTFNQSESGVGNIWDITLVQSTPSQLTAVGIFEIDGTTLTYEVVQTEPDLGNVAPTATLGFGSSNGGSLGTLNVQTFEEIE